MWVSFFKFVRFHPNFSERTEVVYYTVKAKVSEFLPPHSQSEVAGAWGGGRTGSGLVASGRVLTENINNKMEWKGWLSAIVSPQRPRVCEHS